MTEIDTRAETFAEAFTRIQHQWIAAEERHLRFRRLAATERRKRDELARQLQRMDPRRHS